MEKPLGGGQKMSKKKAIIIKMKMEEELRHSSSCRRERTLQKTHAEKVRKMGKETVEI